MAQNEDSIKSQTKSPNSHLPHVSGSDNSISSFDLLNSYRSAAMFLKAAADSQNPRNKTVNLPSGVVKSRYSSTSEDSVAAAAAAAAAASLIPARQHSPSANSKFQAALAMAMAASSSPPSTCPSSSSSGHQSEHPVAVATAVSNEFRSSSDKTQSPSLGTLFRPPHTSSVSYETVDGPPGAGGGNRPNDLGFQPPNLPPNPSSSVGPTNSLSPFVGSGGQPEIPSASTCLTNAVLLPASIVNVLGQQMQSNQYHQPQSPAYLSTINTNSGGGSFSQQHQQATQGGPNQGGNEVGPPSLFPQTSGLPQQSGPHPTHSIPSAASSADTSRYSNPGGRSTSSTALHDDSNNKREQRLLKNREAARECRRKKKEYVRCLERQVTILQDQNRQLIEELQKMKALCAGAFLDPSGQQMSLQPPPDRRNDPGSGMDFVDSGSTATSNPHHHHSHSQVRKPPLSMLSPQAPSDTVGGSDSNNFHPPGEMEVDSTSRSDELTILKSSVSQNQQLLLLHGLSAMKDGAGVRKSEEGDYSAPGGGASTWMSSLPDQKLKFADDGMDTRPPSSSPHIHPVKRVLKRFGSEQHRLSQQKAQQEAQQQVGTAGKPDPDKAG